MTTRLPGERTQGPGAVGAAFQRKTVKAALPLCALARAEGAVVFKAQHVALRPHVRASRPDVSGLCSARRCQRFRRGGGRGEAVDGPLQSLAHADLGAPAQELAGTLDVRSAP